jgi:hypothetical protein
MKLVKILLFIIILLLLPFSLRVWSGDFGKGSSLYTDIKAHRVGDVITVLIYESPVRRKQKRKKIRKPRLKAGRGPGVSILSPYLAPAAKIRIRSAARVRI